MQFSTRYDVVVVGAGVAGVAAALAAARRGHRTALIEKQNLIGGLATSGLIYVYLPLCDGNGTQVTFGISEELLKRSVRYSPFDYGAKWGGRGTIGRNARERYEVDFSPAGFTLALDEALAEAKVDLWLDTRVCAVRKRLERVTALEVENISGRGLVSARTFVDASGEAVIVRGAGGAVRTEVNYHSMWLMEMSPDVRQYPFTESLHIKAFMYDMDRPEFVAGSALDGKMVSRFTRQGWAELRKFYDQSYAGGSDRYHHYPVHLPAMPQFRKIAAAQAVAMLGTGDENRSFADSVGMTGDWRKAGPVWETPFGTLVPEKLEGVFTAGRCIGAVGDAWEIYRVIPGAAMTGEAAGIAAALTVEKKCPTHELPAAAVQEVLRKQKVKLHLDEVALPAKN